MNRLVRAAEWLALLVPAAVILYLVLRYGVNVPYWDQWDLIPSFVALADGSLRWSDLLSQHNEHRMFFPRLVMLSLGVLTRWNVVAEMAVSVVLATATLLVLMALMRTALKEIGTMGRLWATLAVSLLVFSWTQWENWLWGWQIQWFLSVFAAVAAVASATWSLQATRPWSYVAGSAVAAIVGQFSIASGVLIWVVVAPIFMFHAKWRWIIPIWVALAIGATGFFLTGYFHPAHHPALLTALDRPVALLIYVGNYLSGPLGRHAWIGLAAIAAFIVFGGIAFFRPRREAETALPWIAIGGFALANAILTGIGRVGFGAEQGLASRYATISMLLTVSLIPLGILAFRDWRGNDWTKGAVQAGIAVLVLGLAIRADVRNLGLLKAHSRDMTEARECLLDFDNASDACLGKLFPIPASVRARSIQLHLLRWSGFPPTYVRPFRPVVLTGANGPQTWRVRPDDGRNIGQLDEAVVEGGGLKVRGWARHPAGNLAAVRRVLVAADDRLIGEAEVTGDRPDIEAFFRDPASRRSGWEMRTKDVPTAAVTVRAYLVFEDDVLAVVGSEKKVDPAH